jgi:hypothetical protein
VSITITIRPIILFTSDQQHPTADQHTPRPEKLEDDASALAEVIVNRRMRSVAAQPNACTTLIRVRDQPENCPTDLCDHRRAGVIPSG